MKTTRALLLLLGFFTAEVRAAEPAARFDESGFVEIGGIEQWIRVVGEDRGNPVLLMLHGGPGATSAPWVNFFRPWEKHFTIAYWDQRGAGKTYVRHGRGIAPTITIDRIANDGLEVSTHLAKRFGRQKIFILGHSWGSLLGVEMARSKPQLFHAFIGTGQVVNTREQEALGYAEVMRRARAANHGEAIKELTEIGAPPYAATMTLATERKWASVFAHPSEQMFSSPEELVKVFPADFPPLERKQRMEGFFFSNLIVFGEHMDGPMMDVDLASTATEFAVPVFFVQGEFDAVTPAALVQGYVEKIKAPQKKLVLLPGDHNALMALPEAFLSVLLKDVRGLAD
ncbi:MAG: alpha/beta fold hydrolase [Rhodospirillaceae bacterium]